MVVVQAEHALGAGAVDGAVEDIAGRKYQAYGWIRAAIRAGLAVGGADEYGVKSFPYAYLIGPDGKVMADRLHGEGIKEAVAEALR